MGDLFFYLSKHWGKVIECQTPDHLDFYNPFMFSLCFACSKMAGCDFGCLTSFLNMRVYVYYIQNDREIDCV